MLFKKNIISLFISVLIFYTFVGHNILGAAVGGVEHEHHLAELYFYSEDYNVTYNGLPLQPILRAVHTSMHSIVEDLSKGPSPDYIKASVMYIKRDATSLSLQNMENHPIANSTYISGWAGPEITDHAMYLEKIYRIATADVIDLGDRAADVREDWELKGCGFSHRSATDAPFFDSMHDSHSEQCFFSYMLRGTDEVVISREDVPDAVIINMVSTNSPCPKCNRMMEHLLQDNSPFKERILKKWFPALRDASAIAINSIRVYIIYTYLHYMYGTAATVSAAKARGPKETFDLHDVRYAMMLVPKLVF